MQSSHNFPITNIDKLPRAFGYTYSGERVLNLICLIILKNWNHLISENMHLNKWGYYSHIVTLIGNGSSDPQWL